MQLDRKKNKYDDTHALCDDINNNNASFQWQFYDQRRRELYNTLLGHRRQGEKNKDLCKECGKYIFYPIGHQKIRSSINKPVPESKIVGKRGRGKSTKFRIIGDK